MTNSISLTSQNVPGPAQSPETPEAEPLRVAVISSSVRKDRVGRAVADWAVARSPLADIDVDLIDLAECQLPDDDLLEPGGGPRSSIAERVAHADGYVIVTPEYNHSYPASLKRAVDWHYDEWMFKPATVLSYGAQGGLAAAEHLRGVFAELNVVVTRRQVGIRAPWNDLQDDRFAPASELGAAFDQALLELEWWAITLRSARLTRPFTS
jgi:NAD(P)H-dependent FMN reductase